MSDFRKEASMAIPLDPKQEEFLEMVKVVNPQ